MHKIIHLTTVHSRYDVRIFHKMCRSLAAYGFDVTLVVQDGKGNERRDGIRIIDLGIPPAKRFIRILLSAWRAYKFLRSMFVDIIHFHDPELLPLGFLLKSGKRCVIYDSHEDVPRQIKLNYWINPFMRDMLSIAFEVLERIVAKRLNAVVCATPFIAERFKRFNPVSLNVNNFPIQEEFQPTDDKRPFSRTICYVGGISRVRGITELIESLEILKDVTLVMCGPFESCVYEDELRLMAGWKFVDYRGIVGRNEVNRILACSEAGVVTYLPVPNHINAQPNKMFEYMSAGLPIIASNFPVWRRIVEENECGICVDPTSPQEIARAVANILSHEKLCRAKGTAGRKAIEIRFNWTNEAEKLLKLYQEQCHYGRSDHDKMRSSVVGRAARSR